MWGTDLDGDADDGIGDHLLSRMITVPNFPNVPIVLQWWDWNGAEAADYIRVYIDGTLVYDPGMDYSQRYWAMHTVDLTPWRGQTVALTFDLNVCCANPGPDGWYIDDISILTCEPPADLYLSPDTVEATGCVGVDQTHSFNLANWTGSAGTFDLTYALAQPSYGTLSGPITITLNQGEATAFDVTLSPEVCLPDNTQLLGSVTADGNGYTDISVITKTVNTGVIPVWQSAAATPLGVRYHAVAEYDGYIYQFGGETGWWVPSMAAYRYDMAAGSWAAIASLPTARYGMDAVTIGGLIYLPGGSDDTDDTGNGGTFLSDLAIYDPVLNSWSSGAAMPAALAYASAVAHDGKLYVIGGLTDAGTLANTLYIYDPGTNSWSSGAAMSAARGYAAAGVVDGKIYVAGGWDGSAVLASMEVYNPATNGWTAGPDAPKPAGFFGDGEWNGRYLVAFNGDAVAYDAVNGTTYSCSQDAYIFDTLTGLWQTLPDLNRCLYGSQGVAADNTFFLVSGRTNEGSWHMATEVEYLEQCPACTDLGWLDGHVYDYDGVSPTCTDAVVELQPGGQVIPVNASGYYTAAVIPFNYLATATAVDYPVPNGPVPVTVVDGLVTTQDFVMGRADISVDPLALSDALVAVGSSTHTITITNDGSLDLSFEIREVMPSSIAANLLSDPAAVSAPGVEVEPELEAQIRAEETTGYLIYFDERPDLTPAFQMGWVERGRFVVDALQQAAERSQPRVRAYLDARGVAYKAFWIDNVISVQASNRATFDGLKAFPEIEVIRARRNPILYEPVQNEDALSASLAIEPNIIHVYADQVWDMGITGEGIVVANIDTGVNYTHPALVNQYRGNLGGNSFDHNYNWWDPALGGQELVPNDYHDHGSHTMGTILGDDGGTNQIGMAPGASWLACQAFESGDDELLECGQFMAAPWNLSMANPNPDLRPHIINNSWGDCLQYADHWYDGTLSSWHALGIYPVFSNGNASNCGYSSPPGCNTVGNPARSYNVTGVGSTGRDDGLYATHSNWGPTDDPDTINPLGYPTLKPQVMAPGVSIRSAGNSGTEYVSMGGTSMSAPHVTGLVALMWQAAPCLVGDYATTETIIQQTATAIPYASNCGGEGPGNVPNMATGWGEINALAAVEAAMDQCGADWLPWVSTDPITGTVPTGNQVVEVTFTCSVTDTLLPQPLEGMLRILHDDPCAEPVEIDLSLTCISQNPIPRWDKEVWLNGELATSVPGPHTVRPGEPVTIVDWVGATFSVTISAELTENWSDAVALVGYDTGGVGTATEGANSLVWELEDVAPNVLYPITKTFAVQYGDWTSGWITESLLVEGALDQIPDKVVELARYQTSMTLDKDGPAEASNGETIPITLTVLSSGGFRGSAVLTDVLPAGMTFAGNLVASYGEAWEDSGVVHWTSYTTTLRAPAQTEVLVLTPDVGSGGGDVSGLVTALTSCSDVNVTVWDPDTNGEPSVADLLTYQVVVVGNDILWNNMDKAIVGNNLADYVDAGGKVIEGLYIQSFDTWGFAGRYMTGGYSPFTPATLDNWNPDTMNIVDPTHPVVLGVSSIGDNWGHQNPGLAGSAHLVANWTTSGYRYVAVNDNVVALNQLLHHQADWTGDVPLLLCNAIDYLMAGVAPPMPAEVTITFDAQVSGPVGTAIQNMARVDWGTDWTDDMLEVRIAESQLFLPIVVRNYLVAPDLVIDAVVATADNIQVTIRNQGNGPVTTPFWVDAYIDPSPAPTAVNQIWELLADEGLAWGVDSTMLPLNPGEALVLAYGDAAYVPERSNFSGNLPAGTPVYAQVDSANVGSTVGGVLESHEILGGPYNNVFGPVASTATVSRVRPLVGSGRALARNLPVRP